MTWVWKLPRIVIDQFPAPRRSRLPRPTDRKAWRHAETDLRHEPDPGRLHRRARRRPRLERAERRAVSVVAQPGVGDRAVDVRAQAVGGDEFPLADRRPAARRHPGADRVRAELAGHAEGGVLLDDRQGRLEHPPGHRRRCSGDHPTQGRRRRADEDRWRNARWGGHAGRAGRRVRDRHPSGAGGRRHTVLHRAGQLGEPEPGGDADVFRRRGPDQVRDEAVSAIPAVERSRLPAGLRFHGLRHSYATWLVSDGVPINVVSRLMGYEQISTTLNRYTHDARDYADLRVRAAFAGLAADDLLTSGES